MNYSVDPMNFISGSGVSALSLIAPSGTRILNAIDLPGCDIVYDNECGWIGYLGVISSAVLASISTAKIGSGSSVTIYDGSVVINKVYNGTSWVVSNPSLVERTLYNYTPLALPAGVATEVIATSATQGIKSVPALAGKTIKFVLNYNIFCSTASTTWALALKLGSTTLYSGSTTGQQQTRKLEFILDQANNYIYLQRNTLVDNAAAILITKVAFSDWANPQALSLTINPTAAGQLIGLEGGYAE